MKINTAISELIGAIIGDGNIYAKRPSYVEITGNQKLDFHYFNNVLSRIVKEELNYTPRIFFHQRAIRLRINNKNFVNWLVDLGIPSGSKKFHTVKIPQKIYNDDNLTKFCIRGIFDTDGFIYWDRRKLYQNPYPRLGITTCSNALFNQLVNTFKRHGFRKMYIRRSKDRLANDVEIYGVDQLQKWMSIIGSSNKKNLDKIVPR